VADGLSTILGVNLVTPRGVVVHTEADSVQAPGELGEFELLPGHIPMLTAIRPGVLTIGTKARARYAVSSGYLRVDPNGAVEILVEQATPANDVESPLREPPPCRWRRCHFRPPSRRRFRRRHRAGDGGFGAAIVHSRDREWARRCCGMQSTFTSRSRLRISAWAMLAAEVSRLEIGPPSRSAAEPVVPWITLPRYISQRGGSAIRCTACGSSVPLPTHVV
jgi:F-type H+-transporting ATPase subunit epsilon